MRAIIAGGGIGGLTAATALAQRGWDVVLYERQPEIGAAGSGIYIWENGLRVLDAIGAGEVTRHSFQGSAIEQRDGADHVLDPGGFAPGVRVLTVDRAALASALAGAARRAGVEIRTGSEVVGATAHGELLLRHGQVDAADLAIGADGIWSSVRRSLGLEVTHEQTIEGGHRAIIRATQADLGPGGQGKYIEVWEGERRFLITPLDDERIYLALPCPSYDEAGKRIPLDLADWSRHFPRWAHLIERIESALPWSPYSNVKVSSWSSGRTAIMGDAAHAQPPNLGQGGGMAMQSGLALAVHMGSLTDRRDVPDALRAWEADLRPLVDHCQKWSNLYQEFAYVPNEVRRDVIPHIMSQSWVQQQFSRAARSVPLGTE